MGARIEDVDRDSIAEEIGIEKGDILLSINGYVINDILDYQFYGQDDYIEVEIQKPDGEIWSIEIEKDYDDNLGMIFDDLVFDKMKTCRNRCIFCFVDQLPRHMRKTLYIKDDDFRYSFLFGNFITLTNLSEADWEKIITMKLSPLYVSVHCIQPELRAKMLNTSRAITIKDDLKRLKQAGIEVHTQIVLCPGVNDSDILIETLEELAGFYPSVISIGIVPVGLTGYRDKLEKLTPVSKKQAGQIIEIVNSYQKEFRKQIGRGLIYLADEFYLKAGVDFPPAKYYDDYPQTENGIGLARILLDEFASLEPSLPEIIEPKDVYIITGVSAKPIIKRIVCRLNEIRGLSVIIIPVVNNFFKGNVSVTGLLTGTDIINTLGSDYEGKMVIIPEVVFRDGQDVLLDNISLMEITQKTKANIITVDGTANDLISKIL